MTPSAIHAAYEAASAPITRDMPEFSAKWWKAFDAERPVPRIPYGYCSRLHEERKVREALGELTKAASERAYRTIIESGDVVALCIDIARHEKPAVEKDTIFAALADVPTDTRGVREILKAIGLEARRRRGSDRPRLRRSVTIQGYTCVDAQAGSDCACIHGTVEEATFCRLRDELAGVNPGMRVLQSAANVDAFGRMKWLRWYPWGAESIATTVAGWREWACAQRTDDAAFKQTVDEYLELLPRSAKHGPLVQHIVRDTDTHEDVSERWYRNGAEVPNPYAAILPHPAPAKPAGRRAARAARKAA